MKFEDNKDKIEYLEKVKKQVLRDIENEYNEAPFYDTRKVDISSSEEYFNRIVDYCKDIRERCWSNNVSVGYKWRCYSSAGLARKIEKKLGWKVLNEWVKLAIIMSGLVFMSSSVKDEYNSKRLSSVDDIFDSDVVFVFRYSGDNLIKTSCLNDYYIYELIN